MNKSTLDDFIQELNKLPTIGPKTAMRLALYFVKLSNAECSHFVDALQKMKATLHPCSICMNLTDHEVCAICEDGQRDEGLLAVVENYPDVWSLERSGQFHGRYHVLGGSLNPLKGVSADHLSIRQLIKRIESGKIREVILATNPNTEGEMTAIYLARALKPYSLKVSRLAYGLPVGCDLEFADVVTLSRAVSNRQSMSLPDDA